MSEKDIELEAINSADDDQNTDGTNQQLLPEK